MRQKYTKDLFQAWTAREDLMLVQLARKNIPLKVIAMVLGRSDEATFIRSIQLRANVNLRANPNIKIKNTFGKAA
jgi:hypothetical protein